MKVLILGAGVAGVASAWYFCRDGHDVTVLERNHGVALETSFANGGQLSYSYVAPLASPSVIPKIPPWLLRRDSPLRFRPELDPAQWRWIVEFLAACNNRTADETTQRLLRLAFYSRDLMHDLVAAEKLVYPSMQLRRKTETGDTVTVSNVYRAANAPAACGNSIYGVVVTIARQ